MKLARLLPGLLLAAATIAVAWAGANQPPPLWLLEFGLAPGCEPTGRTTTVEGIEFVEIGPGAFRMGSDERDVPPDLPWRLGVPIGVEWGSPGTPSDEAPVHWVRLDRAFWIARHEITGAEWLGFRTDPFPARTQNLAGDPMTLVNWWQAKEYCDWLAERSGRPIRLPTEAEWAAAFRASGGRDGPLESDPDVWEWCEDTYHTTYGGAPRDGSAWSENGQPPDHRVLRGGSARRESGRWRLADRRSEMFIYADDRMGFRPVFSSTTNGEELTGKDP